jgi:integrase
MRTLRLLWNAAAEDADDDETLPANPVRLKKRWFDVERRERMVRSDQLPAFYKAVNKLPSRTARDYLLLLLFTGLRRREASTLRWDDVDSPTAIIRLPASTTKAGRKLDLPMSSFVRELLDVRCANATEAANKFVFPADSRSRHIEEPKFPLGLVAKATGIAVSVHDLRRTYITVAESADISPIALKGLVNHSLGNDVTSGYIQMPIERLREAAEKVCERMKQLCEVEKLEGAIPMSLVSG